jgi:hypothetical protein
MRGIFARIGAWCVERPVPVLALALLAVLVGAVVALSLRPNADVSALVDRGSRTYAATEEYKRAFGDDPIVVLVEGKLDRLLLTRNIVRLLMLETCLAGAAPEGQLARGVPTPEPCLELAEKRPARVVYGPATFLNEFALQAFRLLQESSRSAAAEARREGRRAYERALREGRSREEAEAARERAARSVVAGLEQQFATLLARFGRTGLPSVSNPAFVSSVVFDPRFPDHRPKARFAYLFPSPEAALISVRLRPDLSEQERREAIALVREALAEPAFRLRGGEYLVSGVPVVIDGLATELSHDLSLLLAVAVALMAAVLAVVFGPPLRMLPLAVALGAAALLFGGLALVGGELTLAALAVLPILIGLAVDYGIQFHARFRERRGVGSSPARAAAEAAALGGPVIGTACAATIAGFLALLLSPIPMVRSFGLLLIVGVAIAFALALTAGLAALSLARAPGAARGLGGRAGVRLRAAGKRAVALSVASPRRALVVAALVAVLGWVAGTRTEVISDLRELAPTGLAELRSVDVLQEQTGVSGEVSVTVKARDLTAPALVAWMRDYRERVLELGGFRSRFASCRQSDARICPSIALPDLLGEGDEAATRKRIRDVLRLLPPYFAQAMVEVDPESGRVGDTAVLSFGIKVMPFDEQKELIDGMREAIPAPEGQAPLPAGARAEVVGLTALAADANAALAGNRYLLMVVGLLAVAAALLALLRSLRRALVPLVPIVFATGWAALLLELAGLPLNPMSATLGALVIAIATEFSVLLSVRFHEERAAGSSVSGALRRTYSRTGVAVLASGVTSIAGFGALVATDIRMLRDFGLIAVLDLSVALAGVMLVLPAALIVAEGGARALPRRLARVLSRKPRAAER